LIAFGFRENYLRTRSDGQVMMRKSAPKRFLEAMARHGVRFNGETMT
jgi:hypothetical protein